jgi:anti-sigma factor RsiW
MMCAEVDMLVHPYLDGELVAEERVLIEAHVAGCPRCRELVGHESTFKANLRARLRPRGSRSAPPAPEGLRRRVLEALDRADQSGAGPASRLVRIATPALGALATAAAIAIFFGGAGGLGGHLTGTGRQASTATDSGIVDEAIAGHMKNLPVEVGGTDDEIRSWMMGKVAFPVRPPDLRAVQLGSLHAPPRLIGARLSHLASRDAGQIVYRVGPSQVTVFVFDASGWEVSTKARRTIDGREVYIAERAGYSVVMYRDRGVGYALASDLDEDSLLALVAASLRD